jgi:hypothetical protein
MGRGGCSTIVEHHCAPRGRHRIFRSAGCEAGAACAAGAGPAGRPGTSGFGGERPLVKSGGGQRFAAAYHAMRAWELTRGKGQGGLRLGSTLLEGLQWVRAPVGAAHLRVGNAHACSAGRRRCHRVQAPAMLEHLARCSCHVLCGSLAMWGRLDGAGALVGVRVCTRVHTLVHALSCSCCARTLPDRACAGGQRGGDESVCGSAAQQGHTVGRLQQGVQGAAARGDAAAPATASGTGVLGGCCIPGTPGVDGCCRLKTPSYALLAWSLRCRPRLRCRRHSADHPPPGCEPGAHRLPPSKCASCHLSSCPAPG